MVQIGDFELKEDRYYTKDHLWILQEGDDFKMGIDPMGFVIAGKISMIRVKKAGKPLKKGRAFGTMESGKGVVPLKSPFNGSIIEVNPVVEEKKFDELIKNPFENWLVKIKIDDQSELEGLMKTSAEISAWAKEELAKIK
ncbi:MAG: glycine cleavage system protein H [Promethearchaeota archaeon]